MRLTARQADKRLREWKGRVAVLFAFGLMWTGISWMTDTVNSATGIDKVSDKQIPKATVLHP
ncbi:MAG: hypothetical protein U9N14_01990 [Pseudomonadota bacterium]|nr:hypothetical protein [Pseudomonadota bacterium]